MFPLTRTFSSSQHCIWSDLIIYLLVSCNKQFLFTLCKARYGACLHTFRVYQTWQEREKPTYVFFRGRDLHVVSTVNYLTSTTQILSIQVTYMFRSRKSADYEKYRLYQSNCFLKEDSKIFKILIMNWFHSTTWQWFSLWMYYLSKYVWNEKFPMNFPPSK